MKYPAKKVIVLSLFSVFGLYGCGGGSSGGVSPSFSASGTAIDGLLDGATACIDANTNFVCDPNEDKVFTDNQGQYSFTDLTTAPSGQVLVVAASNIDGNETGKTLYLTAEIPSDGNLDNITVSPLTTLINAGMDEAELRSKLDLPEDYDFNEVYEEGTLVADLAKTIAQKIADELENNASASTTAADILANDTNPLKAIIDSINNSAEALSVETLRSTLSETAAEITIDYVADATLEISLSNSNGDPINGASIVIDVYDNATNTLLESTGGEASVVAQTNDNGQALVNLPKYDVPKIDLHATIAKEGFVTQQKVYKGFANGAQIPSNLTMLEEAVETFAVNHEDATTVDLASAQAASLTTGNPTITFALVKNANGEQRILGGQAAAQAMADGDAEVQVGVQIPTARVGDDVTAITAGIRGFNPMDSTDAQSFPGTFEGIGEPENVALGVNTERLNGADAQAAAEEGTYQLISSSFSQIRLTDQNGTEFDLADTEDVAAPAADDDEKPVIYLNVPQDSYSTITEDMATTDQGIQVPIYVYRSGQGWVLIGLATLVTYDSTANDNAGGYVNFTGIADETSGISSDVSVYAQIEITEGNDWIQWVNIDWPIKAGDLTEHTFKGTFQYDHRDDAQREDFKGSARLTLPNGSQEWLYIDNGNLDYTALLGGDQTGAEIQVWNDRIGAYETFTVVDDNDTTTTNTYDVSSNPALLQNPYQCQVIGVLNAANGEPADWNWMQITDNNGFYNNLYTDQNGNYEAAIPCDTDIDIRPSWYGETTLTFNANGTVATNEATDNAESGLVELSDYELPNQTPQIWAWTPAKIKVPAEGSNAFMISASAWDADGSEVNIEFNCPSSSAQAANASAYNTTSCTINGTDVTDASGAQYFDWSATVTDDLGATNTYAGSILAELENINHAPVINSIQKNGVALSCDKNSGQLICNDRLRSADTASYTVNAYDPDGNDITLTSNEVSLNDTSFEATSSNSSVTITATDTPAEGFTELATSAALNITEIANKPPRLTLSLADLNIIPEFENAMQTANIYVSDDATDLDALINSAEITITNSDDETVETNILAKDTSANKSWEFDVTNLPVGRYNVAVTVTDSDLEKTTKTGKFQVANSQAPFIDSLTASPSFIQLDEAGNSDVTSVAVTAKIRDDFEQDSLTVTAELIDANDNILEEIMLNKDSTVYGYANDFDANDLPAGNYRIKVYVNDLDNDTVTEETQLSVSDVVGNVTITIE